MMKKILILLSILILLLIFNYVQTYGNNQEKYCNCTKEQINYDVKGLEKVALEGTIKLVWGLGGPVKNKDGQGALNMSDWNFYAL